MHMWRHENQMNQWSDTGTSLPGACKRSPGTQNDFEQSLNCTIYSFSLAVLTHWAKTKNFCQNNDQGH